MSQITEQLWLGTSSHAANDDFLLERRITHILCCAEEVPLRVGYPYSLSFSGYKISAESRESLIQGAAVIDSWINGGFTVIVHCATDMRRSASVVAEYLMLYKKWSYELAYGHIKLRANILNQIEV